MKKAKQYEG